MDVWLWIGFTALVLFLLLTWRNGAVETVEGGLPGVHPGRIPGDHDVAAR